VCTYSSDFVQHEQRFVRIDYGLFGHTVFTVTAVTPPRSTHIRVCACDAGNRKSDSFRSLAPYLTSYRHNVYNTRRVWTMRLRVDRANVTAAHVMDRYKMINGGRYRGRVVIRRGARSFRAHVFYNIYIYIYTPIYLFRVISEIRVLSLYYVPLPRKTSGWQRAQHNDDTICQNSSMFYVFRRYMHVIIHTNTIRLRQLQTLFTAHKSHAKWQ